MALTAGKIGIFGNTLAENGPENEKNTPDFTKEQGKTGGIRETGSRATASISQGVGLKSLRICSFLARRNSPKTSAR